MAVWDDLKKTEKPHRTSALDGIPQGMPALALADKLLGRAHKVGLLDATKPGAINVTDEDELGPLLLAIVASAKANGLDSERALRTALRELQREIREHEVDVAGDAGVIGTDVDCGPPQPEWRGHPDARPRGMLRPRNRRAYPSRRFRLWRSGCFDSRPDHHRQARALNFTRARAGRRQRHDARPDTIDAWRHP